jgi:hypothetical protein
MLVSEITLRLPAATPPKVTPVTFVKSVPVMVTVVPPVSGPLLGVTLVMLGAGTGAAV